MSTLLWVVIIMFLGRSALGITIQVQCFSTLIINLAQHTWVTAAHGVCVCVEVGHVSCVIIIHMTFLGCFAQVTIDTEQQ